MNAAPVPGFTRLRSRRGRRTGGGFTLIEVVVAMSIMAMALMALLGVIQTGLKATIQRRSLETAQMLATQVISNLDNRYEKPLDNETMRGDFGPEFPGFGWEYTLKVNANLENLKSVVPEIPITIFGVEARIVWTEDGSPREYVVHSVRGWVEAAKQ